MTKPLAKQLTIGVGSVDDGWELFVQAPVPVIPLVELMVECRPTSMFQNHHGVFFCVDRVIAWYDRVIPETKSPSRRSKMERTRAILSRALRQFQEAERQRKAETPTEPRD